MKQVAVAIIIQNGLVLACQRRRDARYPLKWEFPGGKIEEGEHPEKAVIRELREELEIDIVVEGEFFRQDWTYEAKDGSQASTGTFRVFYMLIRRFAGTLVNHVFEEIRWVTPRELERMDILEGNRNAIRKLAQQPDEFLQRQTA